MIPIIHKNIENQQVNAVDARELHKTLEVKTKFNDWFNRRVQDCGLIENRDYVLASTENATQKKVANCNNDLPHNFKNYFLKLEYAKHFSMMERNEAGLKIRDYFIECERQAKTVTIPTLPFDMTDPLSIMDWSKQQFLTFKQREEVKDAIIQEQSRVILSQVEHLEANKEIEIFVKQMQESKKAKTFTDISKVLSDAFEYPIDAKNLKAFCILKGFLTLTKLPSDKLRAKKYFKVFTFFNETRGEIVINTRITGNGLMFLSQEVKPYKVFFTLKRAEYENLLEKLKDGEKQRRAFIENLKNAKHYSAVNQNELLV